VSLVSFSYGYTSAYIYKTSRIAYTEKVEAEIMLDSFAVLSEKGCLAEVEGMRELFKSKLGSVTTLSEFRGGTPPLLVSPVNPFDGDNYWYDKLREGRSIKSMRDEYNRLMNAGEDSNQ